MNPISNKIIDLAQQQMKEFKNEENDYIQTNVTDLQENNIWTANISPPSVEVMALTYVQKRFECTLDVSRKFAPSHILEQAVKSNQKVVQKASVAACAVVFVDIKGFTMLSEHISMQLLLRVLSSFYNILNRLASKYGGVISSFLGDGAMVVFDTTIEDFQCSGLEEQNQSQLSTSTIQKCKEISGYQLVKATQTATYFVCDALSSVQEFTDPDPLIQQLVSSLDIRVGLNCGQCLVGVFGSEEKFVYTAIGDVVNTASRIEQATRILGVKALASELASQVVPDVRFRLVGSVQAKGKKEALSVFEILGKATDKRVKEIHAFTDKIQAHVDEFQFQSALNVVNKALEKFPDDQWFKQKRDEVLEKNSVGYMCLPSPFQ
ncbi:Adenylate_cyclase [Hexamita inflata]|uniref:Adenylate cyclase n=1 Tax=Hexamita inflata TaxID=28002 RepID=A0AA86UDD6_9EUKA|nr:Adenylate cyclase [Hexamita inflata]